MWCWNEKLLRSGDLGQDNIRQKNERKWLKWNRQEGHRCWGPGTVRGGKGNTGWNLPEQRQELGWKVPVFYDVTAWQIYWGWWWGELKDSYASKEERLLIALQVRQILSTGSTSYLNTQCLERGEFLRPICRSKEINVEELYEGLLVLWYESLCVETIHISYEKYYW